MMHTIFQILPERMQGLKKLILQEKVEEIRFRMGQPVFLVRRGAEIRTNAGITEPGDIGHILSAASENSLYAVNDSLREGFITIPGGHRIGICGQAVMDGSRVKTIKEISSVSVRIARQWSGIGISLSIDAVYAINSRTPVLVAAEISNTGYPRFSISSKNAR